MIYIHRGEPIEYNGVVKQPFAHLKDALLRRTGGKRPIPVGTRRPPRHSNRIPGLGLDGGEDLDGEYSGYGDEPDQQSTEDDASVDLEAAHFLCELRRGESSGSGAPAETTVVNSSLQAFTVHVF